MESFENSVICHYSGSKKISIPAANVNIKQEVDVQDIYIKEETHKQDDIKGDEENILPEIKLEVPEYTISADHPITGKLENDINLFTNSLTFVDRKIESREGLTTSQIFPSAVLQIKIEESLCSTNRNQLNTESFSKLSCSVNLHKGINLSDIAKCKICQKLNQNQYRLNKPEQVHNVNNQTSVDNKPDLWTYIKNKYQCNLCGLKFLHIHNIKRHVENHLKSSSLSNSAFISNKDYNLESCVVNSDSDSHFDVDGCRSENNPYQCKFCGLKFLLNSNLEKHFKAHHSSSISEVVFIPNQILLNCNLQPIAFHNNNQPDLEATDYSLSEQPDDNNKGYECTYCRLRFLLKYNLNKHLKIHSDRISFNCLKCNKEFENQKALNAHCRIHFKEEPYKCNLCEKTFSCEKILNAHRKTHTGETYDCQDCEKTFLSESALKVHSRIHSSAQEYKCIDCDKKFTSEITLNTHITLHSKEKPYECNECGKGFVLESYANRHYLRNHGKDRPYECKDCNKSFSQYNLLRVHSRIHQEEKQYECSQCDRRFLDKFKLARHSKTHAPKKLSTKRKARIRLSARKNACN